MVEVESAGESPEELKPKVKKRGKNYPPPIDPSAKLPPRIQFIPPESLTSDDEDEPPHSNIPLSQRKKNGYCTTKSPLASRKRKKSLPNPRGTKAERDILNDIENPKPSTSTALVREMARIQNAIKNGTILNSSRTRDSQSSSSSPVKSVTPNPKPKSVPTPKRNTKRKTEEMDPTQATTQGEPKKLKGVEKKLKGSVPVESEFNSQLQPQLNGDVKTNGHSKNNTVKVKGHSENDSVNVNGVSENVSVNIKVEIQVNGVKEAEGESVNQTPKRNPRKRKGKGRAKKKTPVPLLIKDGSSSVKEEKDQEPEPPFLPESEEPPALVPVSATNGEKECPKVNVSIIAAKAKPVKTKRPPLPPLPIPSRKSVRERRPRYIDNAWTC